MKPRGKRKESVLGHDEFQRVLVLLEGRLELFVFGFEGAQLAVLLLDVGHQVEVRPLVRRRVQLHRLLLVLRAEKDLI